MFSKFFGKKESATRIHRANGMASIAPAGMENAGNICRTVESAMLSIEKTGHALVPSNDQALLGSIMAKLWENVEWPTR